MPALRVATWEELAYYGDALPKGLLPPIAGAAGPALDHSLGVASTSGTASISTTVASAVPSSELVVVCAYVASNNTITIADSVSDSFTKHQGVAQGKIAIAATQTGGLTTSDTFSASGPTANWALSGASFTGCSSTAATTAYGFATATNTTPVTVTTAVAVDNGDMVLAFGAVATGGQGVSTSTGGWTTVNSQSITTPFHTYYKVSTGGSEAITFTFTSGTMGAAILAFPASPASPSSYSVNWNAVRTAMYP